MYACPNCGCAPELGDVASQRQVEYGRDTVMVTMFHCHCEYMYRVTAVIEKFVTWINENAAVARQLLDDVSLEEILEYWEDQAEIEPSSIVVEA